jgi:hypothetical protein
VIQLKKCAWVLESSNGYKTKAFVQGFLKTWLIVTNRSKKRKQPKKWDERWDQTWSLALRFYREESKKVQIDLHELIFNYFLFPIYL